MAQNIDYAKIPMGKNDIGAKTIGEYFEKLLLTLWDEQEEFSGKRPFGNSGWEFDVYASLIAAGVVDGSLDEEGYVDEVAYSAANNIICETIKQIFAFSTADVVPRSEVEELIRENKSLAKTVNEASDLIRKLKSKIVPRAEVVRCKDCRHRYSLGDDIYCCRIAHGMNGIVSEEDYCSYGRRK